MKLAPLLDYIRRHVELSTDEEALLAERVKTRRYLKGQFIVQQGDVCKYENFVVKGCLRSFHVDDAGSEHTVMFAIEDWWISDLGSFITQTPAYYNVQCLEASELIQFPHDVLQQLYRDIPKLERLFRIILQNAFVAAEKRIMRNFSLPARERYLAFRTQYPEIEQRVPQYMVASYLGITKEFLSRIRSQLAQEGD